jgi:uncharacterized protein with PQ loop repeat
VNGLCTQHTSQALSLNRLKILSVRAEELAICRVHPWSASMLQEVIAFVYSANGVLVSLIYLPQLHTVWNDRTGAQAGSLLTWSLFSLSSVVALLYGVLVLHDGRMVLAAGSSTAGSLSVLGTAVYRRQQAKRQR